jgi:hypothetical protein
MKMAKLRKMLTHPGKNESGQGALAMVLILLMLGAVILTPLLVFMDTGLKAGQVYESKLQEFYAADAGIEDGLWQITYDRLDEKFTSPAYKPYDYYTVYSYPAPLLEVNDRDVAVNITNVWIPWGVSGGAPSPDDAEDIIKSGVLIVTGKVFNFPPPGGERGYEIEISYYYDKTDSDPDGTELNIDQIGVWLSAGFDYVPYGLGSLNDYDSSPDIVPHCGGKAIVWDVDQAFNDVPNAPLPVVRTFDFQFTGPADQNPQAISWITTTGVDAIPVSWEADVKPYRIESTAGGTTAEAYTIKNELRLQGEAIPGDYCAVGATLMTATGHPYYRNRLFRESSATVQNSVPEDPGYIPSIAHIEAAFLYWSGWIEEAPGGGLLIWGVEDCNNFVAPIMDWTAGSAWDTSSGRFRGTAYNKPTPGRYLTMSESIDLSAYAGQTIEVSWQQSKGGTLENDDRLYFAFSADGGSTWGADIEAFRGNSPSSSFTYTIPSAYLTNNFRMRFYLDGFNERDCWWVWCNTEYCYIDNIGISVVQTLVEDAKVNRVLFNDIPITANVSDCQVALTADSGAQDSWSYSCFKDVSNLELGEGSVVKELIEEEMSSSGSGSLTFTLGHVLEGDSYSLYPSGSTDYPLATPALSTSTKYQWTYAGWSLIVIYSSPETKGHQLYLFDDFHYVGQYQTLDFPISGFLAPDDTSGSHLTYFVGEGDDHYTGDYIEINGNRLSDLPGNPENNIFNSYSNTISESTFKSGIDIDTFDMSAYIDPGSTSSDVELGTEQEIYNLIYIILSFRSDITTGGTISYLIRG